jgi:hypothetical protein
LVVFGTLRSTRDAVFPVSAAIASIAPVLGFGSLRLGAHCGLLAPAVPAAALGACTGPSA